MIGSLRALPRLGVIISVHVKPCHCVLNGFDQGMENPPDFMKSKLFRNRSVPRPTIRIWFIEGVSFVLNEYRKEPHCAHLILLISDPRK
jgi:hypothetical protein